MSEHGARSRPAGLRGPNGGFQLKLTLTSMTLNVLSGSEGASEDSCLSGPKRVDRRRIRNPEFEPVIICNP